jgi:glutathione synthetase
VSVVYFRAAYTPNDFPTNNEWKAREIIEESTAIKCPNLAYHLIGAKKMQQVVARPGVLEQFITKEEAAKLRTCFTGIYALDDNEHDNAIIQKAINNPQDYVLKPQREGGGNLIHGLAMQELLKTITPQDRQKYILMQRISPKGFNTLIMRDGQFGDGLFISELGIFGLYLGDGKNTLLNECGSYILRTKLENVEDGGVAAGVACVDSLFLTE